MFEQIKLAYGYDALEPHIDALTMETHYAKHHATYTKNFNDAIEKLPDLKGKSVEEILAHLDAIPEASRAAIQNNGGGFYNHNLYFDLMSPKGGGAPTRSLAEKINADFGSLDALKAELKASGLARFGSGWAWLVITPEGKLKVLSTANQDTPMALGFDKLLIAIDVWEHAYYLRYKNLRADYVDAFFQVLDWAKVAERYEKLK